MMTNRLNIVWVATALAVCLFAGACAQIPEGPTSSGEATDNQASADTTVYHRSMEIEGLDIFYRQAGDPSNPTVLLLHGFPTSSHMFRN